MWPRFAVHPAIQPFLSVCCPIVPYPSPASALGCLAILPACLFCCPLYSLSSQDPIWKHPLDKFGPGITAYSHCHIFVSTSGFWPRVRARALRAPAKLGLLTCQTGRCAPLAHGSFAASYTSPKNNYFQKQIASLLAQTRALPIAASLILSAIFWGQNVLCDHKP